MESTILIIDDNPDTIRLMSAMLREQARVLFATNGMAGLEIARAQRPQLILLDLQMKSMDGFAVCERIMADPDLRHCPVIFVTASSGVESEIACLDAGAVDFITKPLSGPVVQARVRTHLRLQAALASLDTLAHKDGLTGLHNRRYFDEQIALEVARHRRQGAALGVALVDVDHFKLYNDHYGHQMGDECLRAVAQALAQCTRRPGELVARYGGEEFVVLLPNSCGNNMQRYGAWLCQHMAELQLPHAASPVAPHVTISVGLCSLAPDMDDTPARLLEAADKALYEAKRAGRNRATLGDAESAKCRAD
ncbi:diguanylate cyclase (GGDEF) domain-containing protein [Duganella sp. CF458]|uniref:diguanylate cyclase domain-containing protein n=1 Tax=Duganella sp. CF458 TaxID=1884368 RepID=UPI0008E66414|nr:diguanylate cyclase [Duganella sp. CF458]SFG11843.1 diguanylate cyclase (GGDEF) domain-containing protein [Duganella sp. CF458]